MNIRKFLIIALVLCLPQIASSQVLESHKAFMREMRYYLDSKGYSPELTEANQILFNYSGKRYTMALKGREVNPYALLVYSSREYDDIFTKEFVSALAPSEGLDVVPRDDGFRVQSESHVFDAESVKYIFKTVMENLVLYEKGIDDLGASQAEYIRIDDEKWKSVDKNDEAAILAYINETTVYQKRHLNDARMMYDILHSHNSAVEEAMSKVAFAKDLYNRGEARSDSGSKRVYDLLTEASKVVKLDSRAKSIMTEIEDDRAYQAFKDAPDLTAAENYIKTYPEGLYRRQVEDWMTKYYKKHRSTKPAKAAKPEKTAKKEKPAKPAKAEKPAKPVAGQLTPSAKKGTGLHVGIGASYMGTRKGARPSGILEFKLGNYDQRLNWIVGVSGRPDIIKGEGTKSVFTNTALKVNLFPIGEKCRVYIAPGGGYDFLKESVEAYGRAGLCFRHFDVAGIYQTVLYYPAQRKSPVYNYYTGASIIWYF